LAIDNKVSVDIKPFFYKALLFSASPQLLVLIPLRRIDFIVEKTKFFDRYKLQLNDRQLKVITRLFEAGYTGFDGGLSAKNYVKLQKLLNLLLHEI
jgi:hypothetical protein